MVWVKDDFLRSGTGLIVEFHYVNISAGKFLLQFSFVGRTLRDWRRAVSREVDGEQSVKYSRRKIPGIRQCVFHVSSRSGKPSW